MKKPKVKTPSRETAAARLLRLMDEDAEFNWASSWVPEHEYMLWASVVGDESGHRNGGATEPELMRDLAKAADGWFTTPDGADEVEFVPMDRWLILYRQYVERRRSKPDTGDIPE